MGEVYLAEDTTLKRQVALKVLPPDLAASQERLERFQREAETLAALDHPNIVTIYSVEKCEGVGAPLPGAREGTSPSPTDLSPAGTAAGGFDWSGGFGFNGAQGRNRTTDTVIFSHVLYRLSYLGTGFRPRRFCSIEACRRQG